MAEPEPSPSAVLIGPAEVAACLDEMAAALAERLRQASPPMILVGLETGGVRVAEALRARLPPELSAVLEHGALDANFYRDDFAARGLHPSKPSRMPLSLDAYTVVLVDDVVYTGRTARAAINALFDLGRPRRVLLLALVDKPGRELPIAADIVGRRVDTAARVQLAPHELAIVEARP